MYFMHMLRYGTTYDYTDTDAGADAFWVQIVTIRKIRQEEIE